MKHRQLKISAIVQLYYCTHYVWGDSSLNSYYITGQVICSFQLTFETPQVISYVHNFNEPTGMKAVTHTQVSDKAGFTAILQTLTTGVCMVRNCNSETSELTQYPVELLCTHG